MNIAFSRRVRIMVLIAAVCLFSSHLGVTGAAPPLKEGALAGVTTSWDKNLPSSSRFTVLSAFGDAAVRDNNTGLVWERSPSTDSNNWDIALGKCIEKNIGGLFGWRLPSVVELTSVLDPSLPAPFVPGSVFPTVTASGGRYWSATTASLSSATAWVVFTFLTANNIITGGNFKATETARSWCVRGPMNADVY